MDAMRIYEKRTGVMPKALSEKPTEVSPDVAFYLNAFDFLSRFRGSNGFALNPLQYSDIAHYAEKVGYSDPDEFFFLAEILGALDTEYRKIQAEKKS